MLLHRLSLQKHATGMSGEGARRFGGRWNPPGCPVHYTSTTAGLAVLEFLLHVDPDDLPSVTLVTYRLPNDRVLGKPPVLPADWRSVPAPAKLAEIGKQWLESNASLALRVPSVLLPNSPDANVLVNPLHPDIRDLVLLKQEAFSFDPRLFHR